MNPRHGIVSPWTGLEAPDQKDAPPTHVGFIDDALDNKEDPRTFGVVVLEGQGFEIHIAVPQAQAHTGPSAEFGKAVLGACLQRLFAEIPRFAQDLRRQSIFKERPLGPVTQLQFESLTLFAKAGTLHPQLGYKMAVDRLGLSLSETMGWELKAEQILKLYRVELVRKA
jgi:hypothetical protein